MNGWCIMPYTGSPKRISADQRAPGRHAGDEGFGAVDRVEHPDVFGVGALAAVFLADDAVLGKAPRISVRIAASAARSAAVTGSKPPACSCSRPLSAVRKNGRMVSPDTVASWSTKLAKSMAVMPPGLSECRRCRQLETLRRRPACLFAQFAGTHADSLWHLGHERGRMLDFLRESDPQPCKSACSLAPDVLIFVRRGVDYCNAVARATVALLGRFLPRLGPLATASGPFF